MRWWDWKLSSFCCWESWLGEANNLPKVTQLVSSTAGIQNQVSWFRIKGS